MPLLQILMSVDTLTSISVHLAERNKMRFSISTLQSLFQDLLCAGIGYIGFLVLVISNLLCKIPKQHQTLFLMLANLNAQVTLLQAYICMHFNKSYTLILIYTMPDYTEKTQIIFSCARCNRFRNFKEIK